MGSLDLFCHVHFGVDGGFWFRNEFLFRLVEGWGIWGWDGMVVDSSEGLEVLIESMVKTKARWNDEAVCIYIIGLE